MRITNNMMFDSSIRNLNNNLQRLSTAQTQYSTQSKIQVPSDDPVIATRAIKYRDYVADVEQYQKNTSDATSWMQVTDDALQGVADYVTRLKELITNGANDTNSNSSKAAIADEIKEIRKGIIDTMNTSYAGRYVFAGYNTDEPPYKLVTETFSDGSKVDKVLYKGQLMNAGGPMVASDAAIQTALTNPNIGTVANPAYPRKGTWILTEGGTDYNVDLSTVTDLASLNAAISSTGCTATVSEDSTTKCVVVSPSSPAVVAGEQSDLGFFRVYKTDLNNSANKQDITYHVSNGSEVKVNIEGYAAVGWSGDGVYGGYKDTTPPTTNIFDTIAKALIGLGDGTGGSNSYKVAIGTGVNTWAVTTKVETSSSKLVSSCLDELDADLDRLTKSQSELGARMNYVESTDSRLASNEITFTKLQSNNEDIDVAKASVEVSSAQSVYEAALSVTAKVTKASLVDYLR